MVVVVVLAVRVVPPRTLSFSREGGRGGEGVVVSP